MSRSRGGGVWESVTVCDRGRGGKDHVEILERSNNGGCVYFWYFFSIVFVYFNWISIETNSKISSNSTKLVQFQDSTRLNLQYSNNSATFSANSFASCAFIGFDGGKSLIIARSRFTQKTSFWFRTPIFSHLSLIFHQFHRHWAIFKTFLHFTRSFLSPKWPPMLLTGPLFIAVAELDRISPPCCSWLSEGSKWIPGRRQPASLSVSWIPDQL